MLMKKSATVHIIYATSNRSFTIYFLQSTPMHQYPNTFTKHAFNGMTLLHAVIKYNPPIQVLESMIQAHSDAISGQDCLGRTPLHVACGVGSDSSIIRMLVRAYPEACDVQDVDGRTPLHLACDSECVLFEGDQTPRSPPSIGVVRALLSGSLKPVLIEDEDEMSPIEYALVSEVDREVVKLLQLASMTLRRRIAKVDKQIAREN